MIEEISAPSEFESVWLDMIKEVELTGTYHYGEIPVEDFSKQIAFWQTIRWFRENNRFNEITGILEDHAGYATGSEMSATIAQMELLPTPVFRRVLWFYNIDFQSLESCLRRMTTEQIKAISETYLECYVWGRVPKCMKVGLWNRVRQLVPGRRITSHYLRFYNPQDKDLDTSSRYETKAAIAHDFFHWGIGFNSYRKEDSDEKIPSSIALQFLSPKNHENDFTVNQEEGGIYWFLYLYARANYLWGNKDDVHLKRSVCPGFYLTLIIWLFMILFSPILLVTAGLIFICIKAIPFVNKFVKEKIEVDKDFWKTVIGVVLIIAGSNFVVYLGKEMYSVFYDFSSQNHWYTASVHFFIVMYLFYMAHYEKWIWPQQLPWIGKPLLGYILLQTGYDHGRAFTEFLAYTCFKITESLINFGIWVMKHGDIFLPLVFIVVLYVGILYWWYYLHFNANEYIQTKKDICYKALENVYLPITIISSMIIFVSIPVTISLIKYKTIKFWEFASDDILFLLAIGGGITLYIYSQFKYLNPKIVRIEAKAKLVNRGAYQKYVAKNRWIQSLVEPEKVIIKITDFADLWLPESLQRITFWGTIDEKGYKVLKQYDSYFRKRGHCLEDRLILIDYLLEGEKLSAALLKLKQKKQQVAEFNQWIESLKQPFIYVKRWFSDLRDMKRIFDERCPYVSVPKQIE